MVSCNRCAGHRKAAHLLLQVRTRVLNDELTADFQQWYPTFAAPTQSPVTEHLTAWARSVHAPGRSRTLSQIKRRHNATAGPQPRRFARSITPHRVTMKITSGVAAAPPGGRNRPSAQTIAKLLKQSRSLDS